MRVDLLVTGETELAGLPGALGALFPGHEFRPVCLTGFTSGRLPADGADPRSTKGAHTAALRLAKEMAATLVPGRKGDPADFAVVVDDLELVNGDQPEAVVKTFRAAVLAHLDELEQRRNRQFREDCAAVLCERGSFHLVNPMIEAWFFPDPGALRQLGIAPDAPLLHPGDPEAFRTADPAYDAADESACPAWVADGRLRQKRPKWLGDDRQRHPKGYLQWLTRDPTDAKGTRYRETDHGGPALRGLALSALLTRPAAELQYLRALVTDLAAALDVPDPSGGAQGTAATHRPKTLREPVLRNL